MQATDEKKRSAMVVSTEAKQRYAEGWRAGKPVEDPSRLKGWGFVSARPSEFLIRMRRGEVVSAGQGASCFKWPWDSVAVVPTTVQRLQFVADQITSEKVGVQVTGLAVYRIAEPLIAFRMLNFSFPERASEKLEQMLAEMFVGAVRRLVANLTVEQCLTRRKEGLANELMKEIAPVVSGAGRPEDRTHRGWGVVIDTIEVQDVRVLSASVFAHMQARFRHEQEQRAKEAELLKERGVKQHTAEAQRQVQLAELSAQVEVRRERQAAEEKAKLEQLSAEARVTQARLAQERMARQAQLEDERELALAKLASEVEVRQRRAAAEEQAQLDELSAKARLSEATSANERALAAARLQGELEKAQLEAAAARAQAEVVQARGQLAEAELQVAQLEVRRLRLSQELELERARRAREIENTLSPEAIQMAVAQRLPELAAAFQQQMGEVHVTAVDGANPFGYVAAAVEGVLSLARSAGLEVPAKGPKPE